MMREMFHSMDLEGVGKIRWDQARLVMAKMGRKLSDEQFAKLVDRYDIDKNGMAFSSSTSFAYLLICSQVNWNSRSFAPCI